MPHTRHQNPVDVQRYQAVAMLTDALSNLLQRTSGLSHGTRVGMLADDCVALTAATLSEEIQSLLPQPQAVPTSTPLQGDKQADQP